MKRGTSYVVAAAVVAAGFAVVADPAPNGSACRVVYSDADHFTATREGFPNGHTYSGADGSWHDSAGRYIGTAAEEDSTVWNNAKCAADGPAYGR